MDTIQIHSIGLFGEQALLFHATLYKKGFLSQELEVSGPQSRTALLMAGFEGYLKYPCPDAPGQSFHPVFGPVVTAHQKGILFER